MTNLKDEFNIDCFVETGTLYGTTAKWASNEFKKVKTIELDNALYHNVLNEYGSIQNIEFIKGRSQEQLRNITTQLRTFIKRSSNSVMICSTARSRCSRTQVTRL